ncbi:MAG: ImmA/IrrE family metallo-endopeptidase [Paracoccus hibiscisoli]|uniref:ImmA/IrrE family metallo-endopeptidase n=1 Tax=Paracoccus hibiscisoli TaxID=2023261 RepID=UPI0039193315
MVRELAKKYDIRNPPVDPVQLARAEGVDVKFVSFTGEYSGVSGFYDPNDHAIYVNKDEYPLRQTFTVAHELAHALLHKEWASSPEYRVFWRDESRNDKGAHEKEANSFAAHLLVPRQLLDKYSDLDTREMSKLFAVSVPVINNRLAFEYGY